MALGAVYAPTAHVVENILGMTDTEWGGPMGRLAEEKRESARQDRLDDHYREQQRRNREVRARAEKLRQDAHATLKEWWAKRFAAPDELPTPSVCNNEIRAAPGAVPQALPVSPVFGDTYAAARDVMRAKAEEEDWPDGPGIPDHLKIVPKGPVPEGEVVRASVTRHFEGGGTVYSTVPDPAAAKAAMAALRQRNRFLAMDSWAACLAPGRPTDDDDYVGPHAIGIMD